MRIYDFHIDYEYLDDKSSKDIIILYLQFIFEVNNKKNITEALEKFSNKTGYGRELTTCQMPGDMYEFEEDYFGKSGVQINLFLSDISSASDYTRVIPEEEFFDLVEEILQECELMTDENQSLFIEIRKNWGFD